MAKQKAWMLFPWSFGPHYRLAPGLFELACSKPRMKYYEFKNQSFHFDMSDVLAIRNQYMPDIAD